MRALTIRQPWASLVAIGVKHIETRSWPTKYRGELLIHAGLAVPPIEPVGDWCPDRFLGEWRLQHYGSGCPGAPDDVPLPLGAVVAVATLADCVPIETPESEIARAERMVWTSGAGDLKLAHYDGSLLPEHPWVDDADIEDQLPLGWFAPGRWAWMLTDVRQVEPVPAKGRQGIWAPGADLIAAVAHATPLPDVADRSEGAS